MHCIFYGKKAFVWVWTLQLDEKYESPERHWSLRGFFYDEIVCLLLWDSPNSVERVGVRGYVSLHCYEACGNCFNGGMALKTVMDTHTRSTFGTWRRKQHRASPTQIFFFMTPCRKWLQSWTRYDNYFHLTFTFFPPQFYPHKPFIPTYFFVRVNAHLYLLKCHTFKFNLSWYQLIHFKICGYDFKIRSVNELSKAVCTSWLLRDSAWFPRKEQDYIYCNNL